MQSIVVVPTYNERENIERLVPAILAARPDIDVLIVDDNSPDGTGAVAEALAAQNNRAHVLHRPGKQGLGAAYLAGFRYALSHSYKYIIEMDADFSHNPADLPRLIAPVETGEVDLVIGSRWVAGGGTRNWPSYRKLISRGGSLYARSILGVPIRDLTGGFKCFHRRVLTTLNLNSVRASGYGFQIELTYRAIQAGFRVQEIPIMFSEREFGQSKMSKQIVFEAMQMVLGLRLQPTPPIYMSPDERLAIRRSRPTIRAQVRRNRKEAA